MYIESVNEKSIPTQKFPDIWTPTLAVMHSQTDALKACRDLLRETIDLKVANQENIKAAQTITTIVDESILFRSLGGGE